MNAPAVQVTDLSIRFGNFTAVDNISFTVAPGEIFGFLGANGAGKTTTIRMLCGLLVPTSGTATIAGIRVDLHTPKVKEKVGYMSQRFTLYNDLTVQENLAFAASLRKLDDAYFRRREKELLDFIHFRPDPQTLVRDLPGGIKQQVSLVAAMLHDPEIIFLDEPTAGVSPASRTLFWNLIRKLAGAGKTVFVTTHYMDEAEQCGRIALMRSGRIIALDTPAQLKKSAFPEPLYELDPLPHRDPQWIEEIERDKAAFSLKPYGMRHHLIVKDADAWKNIQPRLANSVKARRIEPSLEDVFIRLVEGDRA